MKQLKRIMMMLLMTMTASTTMMAADWAVFGLKGKVKSVTYYNWSCPYMWPYQTEVKKISFNRAGNAIAPQCVKIVRNKKGIIKNIKYYFSDFEDWFDQEIIFDADGRVIRVCSSGIDGGGCDELYYDEDGRVSQSITNSCVEGEDITIITTYTYSSFDAKGNWTKRTCQTTSSYASGAFPTETTTKTESRKIIYY